LRQTNKNFIWLIIDDGSTDNTNDLVGKWEKDNLIEIHYYWQNNKGMHGAHNTAYELIETELNVCIDSDDYMPDDAIEKILTFWEQHGSNEVSGIIGLDASLNGEIIGNSIPPGLKQSTLFNLYQKYGVYGDKKLIYRTELTKQYPYPLFENEKYVGLAYKYYMLDKKFEMLLLSEILCYVEYLPDGSSQNMLRQYQKNPRGFAFYRKELMKLPFANYIYKFRQAIHYVSSSIMLHNWKLLKESPNKLLTFFAIPFGVTLYLYITTKTRSMSSS
jgi:glycosyltransferase involved in cell wall biosynthesis